VRFGRAISVHELEAGDGVRVAGTWISSDRIRARRIEVTQDEQRRRARLQGTVLTPANDFNRTFSLRMANGRTVKVQSPNEGMVYINGRSASIHEIPRRASVTARGNWVHPMLFTGRQIYVTTRG
jgi:hypothetical protein